MMLSTTSQIHFDQVDRHFSEQQQDHVGVSSAEIVDLIGSMSPLGIWRLSIETGQVFWSEDAARIHGMEISSGPVSLNRILARYHPEDAVFIQELLETATTRRNSYRFVMRLRNNEGCYRLVAAAGAYRPDNGGELIGYCHEYQEMVRAVVLTGG